MAVILEYQAVFHCRCIHCGWEWNAPKKPARCARCKLKTWDGENRRYKNHYAKVPRGTEAPKLPRPKETLAALVKARAIIDLFDFPSTNEEKRDLAEIDRQIDKLKTGMALIRIIESQPQDEDIGEAVVA